MGSAPEISDGRRWACPARPTLQTNLVAAYFAFANRIADGLGVQLE